MAVILPPSPGLCKVTFHQECSGRSFGDSLYIQHIDASSWTTGQLGNLCTYARTAWAAQIAGLQDTGCSLVETTALDLSDTAGRLGTDSTTVAGTSAGTKPLPLSNVAHIVWEIARRYRGGKPGFNLSGLDGSMLANSIEFSTGSVTTIVADVAAFIADTLAASGVGTTIAHVAVSYYLNKALRGVPAVFPVTGLEMQQRICSLRKRLGKGING